MSKKFLLFGLSHITGNFGCEALVHGTGTILRKTFPESDIVYVSDGHAKNDRNRLGSSNSLIVEDSAPRLGPRFFLRRLMRKVNGAAYNFRRPLPSRLMEKADCVLSIGGDLYTFADGETETVWPYPWPIIEDGNKIMEKGIPYIIWGASLGPFEKAGSKLGIIVDHLKRCKAIIVRESESYSYLTDKLSIKENVYLAADPAYVMVPEPFEAPFLEKHDKPVIAMNIAAGSIRQVYGHDRTMFENIYKQYIEGIAAIIQDTNAKIVFVPHSAEKDYDFHNLFYLELHKRFKDMVWIVPKSLGARKTKWAVSKCDGLIAMRFHCALAGIGTCVPTILVLTKPKGAKLIKDVYGNMDYSLPLIDFSPKALKDKAILLLNKRDSIRSTLAQNLKIMQDRALYAGEILKQIL